jgi:hydroxymethylpyrimidine/phosphomethylpyrimidine kinase
MQGRVLIIAGSDSGGGAGIQADIKAVTALGGYAMTAITALTAQNTEGVHGIHEVPPDFVREQIRVVLTDLGADCIKTGMLHRSGVIDVVMDALKEFAPGVPIVADPVMVAKGGASLLDMEAVSSVRDKVLPLASLITPNAPEAGVLAEMDVLSASDAEAAGRKLITMGPKAVLVKGGHVDEGGDTIRDLLFSGDDEAQVFESKRIDTRHTHGTGCTLASSIATGIAQGLNLKDAITRASAYVHEAIRTAPGYGKGHGPLNHAHTVNN